MNKFVLFALLTLVSLQAKSQNAYYDALFCSTLRPDDADHSKYPTVSFVGAEKEVLNEFKNFLETPFSYKCPDMVRVRSIFKKIQDSDQSVQFGNKLAGVGLVSLLAPILNLSKMSSGQTDTLLYGLTVYFAEEFRKGYMQTYMSGVTKTVGKVGELQVLFPTTYKKLLTYDPIRYKDFGNEMKSVFDEDLGSSLEHLQGHIIAPDGSKTYAILTPTVCENLLKQPAYPYFDISLSMGQKLINGVHPSDIMGHLDEKYYNTKPGDKRYKDIGEALHFLNIVQRNLRDTITRQESKYSNVWINFDEFSKMNQPRPQAYFMALIYHEDEVFFDTRFKKYVDFATLKSVKISSLIDAKLLPAAFEVLKANKITDLLSILVKIDELLKLKDKSFVEEQNFDMYLKNISELINLIASIANNGESDITMRVSESVNIATNVFHAYNAIRVKNYSNMLLYIENILLYLSTDKKIAEGTLTDTFRSIDGFASFASGIVSAKTTEDVNEVIKTYADPPASFIDKRNNGFRITIGGMPGLYIGREKITSDITPVSTEKIDESGTSIGLSLPVGLDFTWSAWANRKGNRGTIGLFAQAIDLGAMLNYRLKTNAKTLPNKVGWDAVLSPGLSVYYGIPQSPWTIQLGYQRVPALRRIIDKNTSDPLLPSDRFMLRFSYDIPLLRIVGKR
jgi:hypothetical protein